MAEEAAPKSGGGGMRAILWLLIVALLGVVCWLASERNERRFHLYVSNGALSVERGRFFPTGFSASADPAYAPVPVPSGAKAPGDQEFDDQNALDRVLYATLSEWAHDAAKKGDTAAASPLVERANQLPGLTPAQITDLAALRASLAWDDAHADLQQILKLFGSARRKLDLVKTTGAAHASEADALRHKLGEQEDILKTALDSK